MTPEELQALEVLEQLDGAFVPDSFFGPALKAALDVLRAKRAGSSSAAVLEGGRDWNIVLTHETICKLLSGETVQL